MGPAKFAKLFLIVDWMENNGVLIEAKMMLFVNLNSQE
jgi:hypothetical protein